MNDSIKLDEEQDKEQTLNPTEIHIDNNLDKNDMTLKDEIVIPALQNTIIENDIPNIIISDEQIAELNTYEQNCKILDSLIVDITEKEIKNPEAHSIIDNLKETISPIITPTNLPFEIQDNKSFKEDNYNDIFNTVLPKSPGPQLSRSSSVLSEIKEDHLLNKQITSSGESYLIPEDFKLGEAELIEMETSFKDVEKKFLGNSSFK
jgi:hypothetical protein